MSNFIDDQEIEKLSPEERKVLVHMIEELGNKGESVSYGHLLNEVYSEIPVGPFEFIDSPKYLNMKGQIYSRIKYIFAEIDNPDINEAWVCCGRGAGKSALSSLVAGRSIYRLHCLKDPASYFGLIPGTELTCINLSVSESQAKNVVFKAIKNVIERSSWFKGKYSPPLGQELRFPEKHLVAYSGHSGSTAWLGYNILMGILDEADFFVDQNDQSIAQRLYATLKGSLETRFERGWKLVIISSPESSTGFMYEHIDFLREGAVQLDPYKWPKV